MDYPMRDRESREPTTVLDHLRPTVVVRRRVVVDVATLNQPKLESPSTTETEPVPERSSGCYPRASVTLDDDGAPPSSILAPEGYDAVDEDEDQDGLDARDADEQEQDRVPSTREPLDARLDDCVDSEQADSEQPWEAAHPPTIEEPREQAPRPVIPVGPTIAVGTIAKRLGLPSCQVAAELVSRGFFEVTPATVLTRETARIVAAAFGYDVEEVPEPEPVKAPRKRTARRAAPTKRTPKTKSKKRTGRSTRRAA